MNLRTILVHLDQSDRCAARVALAAWVARAHGGHLVGVASTGLLEGGIPAGLMPAGNPDLIAETARLLREHAEAVAGAFKEQIAALGPVSHEVRVIDGDPVDALVQIGRASDLIVLGQTEARTSLDAGTRNLPQQVLLHSGRPVLVVPWAGRFAEIGKHALVAWNGTREAAVAIRDALPLLNAASRVTLICLRGEGEPETDIQIPEMTQWLQAHGIQASAEQYATEISIADALLSRAADLDADMIVMGGYGHTRFRELVLGGVTREILAHMTVPVLMSH